MLKIFSKLLDTNQKALGKIQPLVEAVNRLEPEAKKLKDKDFPAKTAAFRERLDGGETVDDLLPEAFALMREAIRRALGERAFDVQLLAAIALHEGRVAEQRTGEGKTQSAALAAYLNALTGRGVHIVTVNDYLARRDTGWYGQALHFAGLSVGVIYSGTGDQPAALFDPEHRETGHVDPRLSHLRPVPRREAYGADVTYGTNNEFGFDYLRDNMVLKFEDQVQRGSGNRADRHHFAIVDEVDSILIDEARTPLIISAPDTEPTEKYFEFARLINELSADTDYVFDEKLKTANLTEHGLRKIEKKLGIDNLYEKDFDTIHHIENALRARIHFLRDRDYVVKDDQVTIVDEFTGRLMHGRRWSDGLHQAIEAKEGVKIQQESITLATISFQNYFRMYEKLAGMTGTAATEAEEFEKIYKLETLIIPTNLPLARKDHPDTVYKTVRAKYAAIVDEIATLYKKGQPVLVGTTSIEKNEIIGKFLEKRKIPHNLLNAKQHEKEAQVIADAGRKKAITVATNMAGRGVDIVLGGSKEGRDIKEWQKEHDEVVRLGGLHVIGSERHESRRIDNQLRGRSGRQGDPGSTRFFLSLEDDIMRLFGGEQVAKVMTFLKIPEDQPIEHGMVSKAVEQAQTKVEGFHFDQRKRVVEYDDVMNKQREIIYGRRQKLLVDSSSQSPQKSEKPKTETSKETHPELAEGLKADLLSKMAAEVANLVTMYGPADALSHPRGEGNSAASVHPQGDHAEALAKGGLPGGGSSGETFSYELLITNFCEILPLDHASQGRLKTQLEKLGDSAKIEETLSNLLENAYAKREEQMGEKLMREIERFVFLRTIDRLWIDHLDAMDDLREGIGLRGDPQTALTEYKKEAYGLFENLINSIDAEVVRRIFRVQVGQTPTPQPVIDLSRAQTNIDTRDNIGLSPQPLQNPQTRTRPVVSGSAAKKIGRNDPCPCGSGKKYKKCCYPKYG